MQARAARPHIGCARKERGSELAAPPSPVSGQLPRVRLAIPQSIRQEHDADYQECDRQQRIRGRGWSRQKVDPEPKKTEAESDGINPRCTGRNPDHSEPTIPPYRHISVATNKGGTVGSRCLA